MLVNMKEMLSLAAKSDKAVPGFNVFGYEDAKMVIEAAEEINAPVILMTNKDAVEHMNVKYYAALFSAMGKDAKVPVCIHLDHAKNLEIIEEAIEGGYTSVMYDGSQLPFEENMANTVKAVEMAKKHDVSVEAEIGSVGYSDPNIKAKAVYTEPSEAKEFAETTGVDALAVAVGTLHRMQVQNAEVQYDRLAEIEELTSVPLVIHGSTGLKDEDLAKIAKTNVGKVNIGTALRMVFGHTMRDEINNNPDEFDRLKFFKEPMKEVKKVILNKYAILGYK
ncbi:class II fructose-bisphosphate aldolase [Vallitalea okinawensis]|uniref:class II fructose-bisphosphate aldolase n=1 Tax=Vallitalea okinawensis TaxID=2078660 RepID=UPI000CFCF08B|nr:class II fructose-bisphosphate aldolase [Vallitalea okinawensis]